jgi:hypothetical protein
MNKYKTKRNPTYRTTVKLAKSHCEFIEREWEDGGERERKEGRTVSELCSG